MGFSGMTAGDVTARLGVAGDKTGPDRIADQCHHDGNLARCLLRCGGGRRLERDDDVDLKPNELRGPLGKKIGLSFRVANLQLDVATSV
jgi:hypothetical protein